MISSMFRLDVEALLAFGGQLAAKRVEHALLALHFGVGYLIPEFCFINNFTTFAFEDCEYIFLKLFRTREPRLYEIFVQPRFCQEWCSSQSSFAIGYLDVYQVAGGVFREHPTLVGVVQIAGHVRRAEQRVFRGAENPDIFGLKEGAEMEFAGLSMICCHAAWYPKSGLSLIANLKCAPRYLLIQMSKSYNIHSVEWVIRLIAEKKLQPWAGNREVSPGRAASIAKTVTRDMDFGPMPIIVAVLPDGRELIVDGQHRLDAARQLAPDVAARLQLCLCKVECKTENDVRLAFIRVNSGTPVPTTYWSDFIKEFMEGFLAAIAKKWPDVVVHAGYKRPAFPASYLRDSMTIDMDTCNILREAYLGGKISVDGAMQLLESHNAVVKGLYDLSEASQLRKDGASADMLARSRHHGFYIGLSKGWCRCFAAALVEHWKTVSQT